MAWIEQKIDYNRLTNRSGNALTKKQKIIICNNCINKWIRNVCKMMKDKKQFFFERNCVVIIDV